MRFEAKVGERGEILIPADVRDALRLVPDTTVAVELANVSSIDTGHEPDWERLDELVARLRLPMQAAFLADGYESVDAYIDDIRGR